MQNSLSINQILAFTVIAAISLFLAGWLHFRDIGSVPAGFHIDESAVGYNAYSILETGKDEYGPSWPLFFRCFDNYHDPVLVYTQAALIGWLGLDRTACRLPSAVFHLLAAIAFFALSYRYSGRLWIALVSAFAFATLPWAFPISRTAIGGYTPMLLGMVLGWHFLAESIGRGNKMPAFFAAFAWALAMYAHNIGRPMSAVMLLAFALAFNRLLLKRLKAMLCFAAALFILLLPMAVHVLGNPVSQTSRLGQVAVWGPGSTISGIVSGVLARYIEYFSPGFLFISGDSNLRHNTGGGALFIFMAPFALAGIYAFIRHFRHNPHYRWIFLSLISYPAIAILTRDHMHSMRCLNGAVIWSLTSVIGLSYIWRRRHRHPLLKSGVLLMAVFAVIEIPAYFKNYFGGYQARSRSFFHAALTESLESSFSRLAEGETLYIDKGLFPWPVGEDFKPLFYSHILFFGKIDPAEYQSGGIPRDRVRLYKGKPQSPGLLLALNPVVVDTPAGPRGLFFQVPDGARLIHSIPLSEQSNRNFEIYRVKNEQATR